MPLDAKDEVGRSCFGGVGFDGFYDAVVGAAGDDAEAVARGRNRLVVAGIDGQAAEAVGFGCFFAVEERGEEAVFGDQRGVGDGDLAAGGVG